MRVFLSATLKKRINDDPRSLGSLAAAANLNYSQLSMLMRDQIGIGPVVRKKISGLGRGLGLRESSCFREVGRE